MIWHSFSTPVGKLYICADECAVVYTGFVKPLCDKGCSPVIKQAQYELAQYFEDKRKIFDVRLNPLGTPFQKKVWEALRRIPYGKTVSYKDIACAIGNKNACRAVGNANNKNPILIFTPCHRVIAANGDLCGFGAGADIKKYLLNLEKASF